MNTIITIGREYGSRGRVIGEALAKRMNVPFYDKELLLRAAEESGLCAEVMETHDEKAMMPNFFSGGSMHMNLQMPLNQQVFLAQFDAIRKIAAEGSCVIVGRCADYVLKGQPGVTHVFVYASMEQRLARIMEVEGVDESKAREMIRKTDKQRKSYYNFFADGNWGLRSNYDLMLRSDGLSPEVAADAILAFIAARP